VASLIAEVTEFMTLRAGDLLAVGVPENPPLARAGDEMAVEIDGIGRLVNRLVPEDGLVAETRR
jgi:5-oxopent-3-ene-1,2,5-tricarboxylate decarboxylase/2-hydroxyhepta-2,4-diene-1,7-dioate isomerase